MGNLVKIIFFVLFILFILVAGPWCFIWAVNTLLIASGLFPALGATASAVGTPIAFNFWTWLAALVLGGFSVIPRVRRS